MRNNQSVKGCVKVGKKLRHILICMLISFSVMIFVSENANAQAIYSFIEEDAALYDTEFFLGADESEYTGSATLEGVAVSTSGQYVLCFSDAGTHHVNLYDQFCRLVKRFTFSDSGAVVVSFDSSGENLVVFPFRKNVLFKIDDDGKYIESSHDEGEREKAFAADALKEFQVSYAGNTYSFSGKNVFSADSQTFTVTNKDGELLFEYVPSYNRLERAIIIGWIAFIILANSILIYRRRKSKSHSVYIKDYYNSFAELSLQQCVENDYANKRKVKKHNAACKKLNELQEKMKQNVGEDTLYMLLNHEDDRVKINAASFCLQSQILAAQSVLTLEKIMNTSDDATIRLSAKMLLQKYK